MKILLTGANGYIGMRLLPMLLEMGHEVICTVRDSERLSIDNETRAKVSVLEIDFLEDVVDGKIPKDIDIAYFLIHSMSTSTKDFDEMEAITAKNFNTYLENTQVKQVIYLSGIVNDSNLSKHLSSRKNVENILYEGPFG